MKVFDVVLGTVVCLFGALLGFLFWKTLDFDNFSLNRKLVISVVVPVAIIGIGVRRIFKQRSPTPRS